MKRLRSPHRIAAWLALAGMALNAFWPLVVDAKLRVSDVSAEVCSARGYRHHGSAPAEAPNHGVHSSHCTLCPFNAERVAAVPPAAPAFVSLLVAATDRPEFGDARFVRTALDSTAAPRAPPLSS